MPPEPILLPNGVTVVGKPFPRVCARCRTKTVWPAQVAHSQTVHDKGRSYSVVIPLLIVPRCEVCGELHFDDYADEQIRQAVCASRAVFTTRPAS
jgi:hypothetical protein